MKNDKDEVDGPKRVLRMNVIAPLAALLDPAAHGVTPGEESAGDFIGPPYGDGEKRNHIHGVELRPVL